MIFDKLLKGNISDYKYLEHEKFRIYYRGFIIIPGLEDGEISLRYFFSNYIDYKKNIDKLYGSYCIIIEHENGEICIFSDNSGFLKLYSYKSIISDSFLELTDYVKANINDLDYYGIGEFLREGFLFNHTFIKGISIVNKHNYIALLNNLTEAELNEKMLPQITEPGIDLKEYFEKLKVALKSHNVLCDLTGGTDSRMMVALMEYFNVKYDVSISGKRSFIDSIKCEEICKILDKEPLFFNYVENIDYKGFGEVFDALDGQYPVLEYYRNYQYNRDLANYGFDLRVTGANGEMFKDEWWPKLFFLVSNKRIEKSWSNNCSSYRKNYAGLTSKTIEFIEIANQKILDIRKKYMMPEITQSNDLFSYEIFMFYKASNFSSAANNIGIMQYSPLLEYDVARSGFNMKRIRRLFVLYHKNVITKTCRRIAKVRTVKNYTCYYSPIYILRDVLVNCLEGCRFIFNKISKKYVSEVVGSTGFSLYSQAKNNEDLVKLLEVLKLNGIINTDFNANSIDEVFFDKLLTVAMFIKRLSKEL